MPIQTAPPPSTSIGAAGQVHQLRFVHNATKKLLDGIANDQLCAQPGCCMNHALWIVGHLATVDDYFIHEFGKATMTLPEDWHKVFGMGSKPVADASAYPTFDATMKAFDERREALIKWFESLSAAQLRQPTADNWQKYAPTIGDIGPFICWHEGYHGGQFAVLRRGLGLPAAFG